jgi:L-fuconolactonase
MPCWGNVDAGAALIDRYSDTRFIIDHLAIMQPRTPPGPPQPWADPPKVLDLARRANAVIKVSGACTLSREPYPFPDIWDPLARVFDVWGFERCLWGTDWTRAFAVVNYEQALEPFRQTDRLSNSERAMLMGGACAKAYGWSPKKSVIKQRGEPMVSRRVPRPGACGARVSPSDQPMAVNRPGFIGGSIP